MADMMSLLPHFVLERIFIYTSFKDLIRCSMVCKKWYSLLSDEDSIIWRAKFEDAGTRHFRNSKHLSELQTFRSKALAYECAWNGQDASKNIYIKDDCLTLHRKPVAQSSDGIRGKTGFLRGQHYFVVIFQGPSFGSAALVGVCTKDAPMQKDGYVPLLGNNEHGWAWDLSQKKLKHDGEVLEESIEVEVKIKDKIGMMLDMETGRLEFDINGEFINVAITNLPRDKPLYPSASAVYGNSEITLIYYGKPVVG